MNRSTLLVMASLLLVGCGKSDKPADTKPAAGEPAQTVTTTTTPAGSEQKGLTGCAWISESQASTALGTPMKYRSNDGESSNCILDAATEVPPGPSVDFIVRNEKSMIDYYSKQKGSEAVSGLGDQAVWVANGMISTLVVVKGSHEFHGTFTDPTGKSPDMRAKAEAFAKEVLQKM